MTEINAATRKVMRTVRVGSRPLGLAFAYTYHGANRPPAVWVANHGDGSLSEINKLTGKVIGTIGRVGNGPARLAFDGAHLWVSNQGASGVSEVDVQKRAVTRRVPTGAGPDGYAYVGPIAYPQSIWVDDTGAGQVQEIDPSAGKVLASVDVGAGLSNSMAFDGTNIWVTSSDRKTLTQIAVRTQSVIATIPLEHTAQATAYDGRTVWLANTDAGSISQVDPVTRSILRTVRVGAGPVQLAFISGAIWVANSLDNTVSIVPDPPRYSHERILPPHAIPPGGYYFQGGDPINSKGVIAFNATFSRTCGGHRAFVYFPRLRRYVVLERPPGLGSANTSTWGISAGDSVEVTASTCSGHESFIYQVTMAGTVPSWSKPCACRGYFAEGDNSDGIGLYSSKSGSAVLTFPRGAPQVTPLSTSIGAQSGARIVAVGSPRGFVGAQTDPTTGNEVPTVWIDGKTYSLPLDAPSSCVANGMDERTGPHGLRVDVVGAGCGASGLVGSDDWVGTPAPGGLAFSVEPGFVKSMDTNELYGVSTNGSMIFGLCCGEDPADGPPTIYFPGSESEISRTGCGNGESWGDSRGDIFVLGSHPCLAQPKQ